MKEINRPVKVECPLWTEKGTCRDIDANVGWGNRLAPEICKSCQACGTHDSVEAIKYRDGQINHIVGHYKKVENLMKAPPEIIKVMTRRHLSEVENKAVQENPEFDFAVNKKTKWEKVKSSWDMAESFVRSAMSRGIMNKRVELTVKNQRIESCFGNEEKSPCPSLAKSASGSSYCNACGCGDRSMAYLDGPEGSYTKLDYPFLECPRERPGFSNARH
jgi:hypothetical protein